MTKKTPARGVKGVKTKAGKIHLKPQKKDVNSAFMRTYGHMIDGLSVYGLDEWTESLMEYYWDNFDGTIIFTDNNPGIVENLNRKMGERSGSMTRWEISDTETFITYPSNLVVVISKDSVASVKKRDNPEGVKYITIGQPKDLVGELKK